MKQTFNIPDGCKTVSVEQVGNQIITSFEPEKYVPKVGDFVRITYDTGNVYFLEVARVRFDGQSPIVHSDEVVIGENGNIFKSQIVYNYKSIENITKDQFKAEFDKLGYVYDFETHTAKEKRWRAKLKRDYYFVSDSFDILVDREDGDSIDAKRHKNGNYFETKEECQKYCDYLRECSLKYFDK